MDKRRSIRQEEMAWSEWISEDWVCLLTPPPFVCFLGCFGQEGEAEVCVSGKVRRCAVGRAWVNRRHSPDGLIDGGWIAERKGDRGLLAVAKGRRPRVTAGLLQHRLAGAPGALGLCSWGRKLILA